MFIFLVLAAAVVTATKYHFLAAIYPFVVGIFGCIISIAIIVRNFTKGDEMEGGALDIQEERDVPGSGRLKRAGRAFVWVLGLYLLIWLFGFKLGALLFVAGYVTIEARAKWFIILGLTVGLAVILDAFHNILNVFWPEGLLGEWEWLVDTLPWIF
jgi:hypothetical protein